MPRSPTADRDPGTGRWTDPEFIAAAHAWLVAVCARHRRRVRGEIEQPHLRPWATVFRARTSRGVVYLKCCGPSQSFEPRLTELLARAAGRDVPTVVARHPRRDWVLLEEGGRKIRDIAHGSELLGEWRSALAKYARIQRALLGRERELLAVGTPDHRLPRLAPAIAAILEDESVIRRPGYDQLSREDLRAVRAALPVLDTSARELEALGIGPTIQHDDLHDGNILRRGSRLVIFDWGDACVTHPFLSLTIAMRVLAHRARVTRGHPLVRAVRDTYLDAFTSFAPLARLRRASFVAERLGIASRALTWYRVVTQSGGHLDVGTETFARWLRDLARAFPPRA